MERKNKNDDDEGHGIGFLGGLLLGIGGLAIGVAGKMIYDAITNDDDDEKPKQEPKEKTEKEKEEEKVVEAFQETQKDKLPAGIISSFICPITNEIMKDPVITPNGLSYEREAIEAWLVNHDTDPITKKPITKDSLIPNYALKNAIQDYIQSQNNLTTAPSENQA